MREAVAALQKAGITDVEKLEGKLDGEKVKAAFLSMNGDEIWNLRKMLGSEKLQQIFEAAGLDKVKINLQEAINSNPATHKIIESLPPKMVAATMQVESSGGNQFAVSETGALGCMQLTSWIYLKINPPINPFNPGEAVNRAATHLADLYQKLGSENEAVKAYNQGEANRGNAEAQKYLAAYHKAKTKLG